VRRLAWLVAVLLSACAGKGVYHQVRPGETLYRIGKAYGVPYQRIARANGLRDPSRIVPGQRLLVPGADKPIRADVVTPRDASAKRPARDEKRRVRGAPELRWPVVAGTVISGFGPHGDGFHDGIDIATEMSAPVRAAADGEVIFRDRLPGYGNVVILRHAGGYVTVYAHNERNHVKKRQKVRRGQLIATVGRSGRTDRPNLHFEVRLDQVARNPLYFLPPAGRVKVTGGVSGGG